MLRNSWLQTLTGAIESTSPMPLAAPGESAGELGRPAGRALPAARRRRLLWLAVWAGAFLSLLAASPAAVAGTFGKVVPIGGAAAGVALDEGRGVLYVANFTANRIEVVSLATGRVQSSINVASQPSSVTLSPDGKWLLATHYGNREAPLSPANGVTLINLSANNARQTFALATAPLGAAFGINNRALIVTTTDLIIFDPAVGTTTVRSTLQEQATEAIPAPAQSFPPNVFQASVAASADGTTIFGFADSMFFRYDVPTGGLLSYVYEASPLMAPRAISVAADGSYAAMGWWVITRRGEELVVRSEFPEPLGRLERGSHAIDSVRNLIYSQVPSADDDPPVLTIRDGDNLTLREEIQLPEHLAGPSVISADGRFMYASSDSGVTILPVGDLNQAPRLHLSVEDMVFRGDFCERGAAAQTFTISDPGGAHVPFSIFSSEQGVRVTPSSGVTPAVVTVTVDPNSFAGVNGTVEVTLSISSSAAVNLPKSVRVLVNSREPDQRGTFVNVPGTLVDLVANPSKDEYYVLRQDANLLYIFDGSNHTIKKTLRTCTLPTSLAITYSRDYLLVGCDASEQTSVVDLQTLRLSDPIYGQNARIQSIAVSSKEILAVARDSFGGPTFVASLNMATRRATKLPQIGIWDNEIAEDSVAVAAPNGSSIMIASSDGAMWLYDANPNTFTISRKDFGDLSGAYAASSFGTYVVGNRMFNSSLVPTSTISPSDGFASGFAFVGQDGFFVSAPSATGNGVIQRVNGGSGAGNNPTRTVEAPHQGTDEHAFTRTIAPLASGNSIVLLTVSGVTVLPPAYDASVAPPSILRVVSAADGVSTPAPGGLFSVYGERLSATNIATSEVPLPTALAGACLTVNGLPVPMIFVSSTQANAQMPFQTEGQTTMIMHTPGGVSDSYNLVVNTNAPAVFSAQLAGPGTTYPTVVRAENNLVATGSNPVHHDDILVIYLTGLGAVSPSVESGVPSPFSPLATTTVTPVVRIGGVEQPVLFSGLVPGQVGLYQINVRVLSDTPTGLSQPLTISQGTSSHEIRVRVVN